MPQWTTHHCILYQVCDACVVLQIYNSNPLYFFWALNVHMILIIYFHNKASNIKAVNAEFQWILLLLRIIRLMHCAIILVNFFHFELWTLKVFSAIVSLTVWLQLLSASKKPQ